LEYCGYSKPRSPHEVSFEILGLESVIKMAEQRISILKQSRYLAENLASSEDSEEAVLNEDI
jgi:hypothetical protein